MNECNIAEGLACLEFHSFLLVDVDDDAALCDDVKVSSLVTLAEYVFVWLEPLHLELGNESLRKMARQLTEQKMTAQS